MTFILNFHGIGHARRPYEEGEEPYWVSEDQFRGFLDIAEASGTPFAVTFDDGNDSDHEIAVPELRARSLEATFFVLAGKLDQPGYLTSAQVRQIDADPSFEIGSHGMDHRPWPDLSAQELLRETQMSQAILSELCGRPVQKAGLPFGRYNGQVLSRLEAQGYRTIYSSDGSPRLTGANPIPRFSLRRDTAIEEFAAMLGRANSLAGRLKREAAARLKSLG